MKITRFEDILAWQEARKLVKMVYGLIRKNEKFSRDFRLVSQIQAAAVSSMSNIAEGFSRKGHKNLFNFSLYQKAQLLKFKVSSMLLSIKNTFSSPILTKYTIKLISYRKWIQLYQVPELSTQVTQVTQEPNEPK